MDKAYSIKASNENRFVASIIGADVSFGTEDDRLTFRHKDAAEQCCAFCEATLGDSFHVVEEVQMMVCARVDGRVLIPVFAANPDNIDAIIESANRTVSEMDFGNELEDIDWDVIYIEDVNGNRVYER